MQIHHFAFSAVYCNVCLIVRQYLQLVLQLAIHDLSRGASRLENNNVSRCFLALCNVMLHECLFEQYCLRLRPNKFYTITITTINRLFHLHVLVKIVFNNLQIAFWGAEQSSQVKRCQNFIAGNAVSVINMNYIIFDNLHKKLSKTVVESAAASNLTHNTKITQL